MADISSVPFVRHLRTTPTTYVRHLSRGRVAHEGAGLSFWFSPLSAAISEIPVDDREQPLLFHARTLDFQDVTVQATVTYRFDDPARASGRLDFGIDTEHGRWRSTPLEQVGGLLTELAQQHALHLLAGMTLPQALAEGMAAVRERIGTGLATDTRLTEVGLAVVDVRVVAVRADGDVERALQTPTREQVQAEADKATYERRAIAVERERAIAENELQNQIELARREESLVGQRGANERSRATEQAAADRIAADAEAEGIRVRGAARADAEGATLAAYDGTSRDVLLALALKELAGQLPDIGSLTVTPDVLTGLLARIGEGGGHAGEAA